MIIKPYKTELDSLKIDGEKAIDALLLTDYQENFYFDFKEISTSFGDKTLSDNDRRNLAKAISGFANTAGGLIVWGIHDKRNNSFDKKPIEYPEKFVGLINDSISKLTLPMMSEVNSFVVKDSDGSGYIVTEIPKYYFSPVQVSPHLKNMKDVPGRYFIRSGSDFQIASHDIISGLYNRQEQSRVEYVFSQEDSGGYQETSEIMICSTGFVFQNKGPGVLKDIWVNFGAKGNFLRGVKITPDQTSQTQLFTGWNINGMAVNLITDDSYKMGPQHIIKPFILRFIFDKRILKSFTEPVSFYISFGAPGVVPKELNLIITPEKVDNFLKLKEKNSVQFIKYFLE